MWYLAYNVLLLLAAPAILLVLLAKKRCRRGMLQRLGFLDARWKRSEKDSRRVLWVHAVSLGEVMAIVPLARELHGRYPGWRLVISTVTETGREAVEQRLEGVAEHVYAPLDFPWTVSWVVRRLNPIVFIFVETELWPNLLRCLGRRNVMTILVNGRISSRSFSRYALIKPFMRQILDKVSLGLMQTDRDLQRIIDLGASPSRVVRTGNIKFDQPLPRPSADSELSREAIGVETNEDLIVAGSTHAGEEEHILDSYRRLRTEFPALVLLLAPRHIERLEQVESTVRHFGLTPLRRTALSDRIGLPSPVTGRVIILDTRGELAAWYRHACVAFVGGTLVEVGGHNLLEPAAWGRPVFFGPFTDHCSEIAQLLQDAGGGVRLESGEMLHAELRRYLRDRKELERVGRMARRVVEENQGAAERAMAHITKALDGLERPVMGDK